MNEHPAYVNSAGFLGITVLTGSEGQSNQCSTTGADGSNHVILHRPLFAFLYESVTSPNIGQHTVQQNGHHNLGPNNEELPEGGLLMNYPMKIVFLGQVGQSARMLQNAVFFREVTASSALLKHNWVIRRDYDEHTNNILNGENPLQALEGE